jgi:glucose-1-phosphate thymidylyltransferase
MSDHSVQRAVILARGLGTRMRREDGAARLDDAQARIAETGVKALIPIERPFLDYSLTALADAGVQQICLVIGPEHHDLRRYYGHDLKLSRISIDFAVQQDPLGTANAIIAAEDWAGGRPFLMLNSDNYYPAAAIKQLASSPAPAVALFERSAMIAGSNVKSDRIKSFAVGLHREGCLERIIEKPSDAALEALGDAIFVSMNLWLFDQRIFDACRAIPKSSRGEYELPDAVQWGLDRGVKFGACLVRAPVLDLSSRADISGVKERLSSVEVRL